MPVAPDVVEEVLVGQRVAHLGGRSRDSANPARNPNLSFVLHDAVDAVEALRAERRTVLLHCVQAQSRTPTVAALFGARITGRTPSEVLDDVLRALPRAHPNPALRAQLER